MGRLTGSKNKKKSVTGQQQATAIRATKPLPDPPTNAWVVDTPLVNPPPVVSQLDPPAMPQPEPPPEPPPEQALKLHVGLKLEPNQEPEPSPLLIIRASKVAVSNVPGSLATFTAPQIPPLFSPIGAQAATSEFSPCRPAKQ